VFSDARPLSTAFFPKRHSKVKIEHLPYAEDVEDVCEEENFTVVDVGFGGLVVVVLVLFLLLFLFPVPCCY